MARLTLPVSRTLFRMMGEKVRGGKRALAFSIRCEIRFRFQGVR